MKRLIFIPMDYKYSPHVDWFNSFSKHYDCLYYKGQDEAIEFDADIIFSQSSAIDLAKMKELKKDKTIVCQWTGDCREKLLPEVMNYKNVCDATFLAVGIGQKEMYEKALRHPVFYLQHAPRNSFFKTPRLYVHRHSVPIVFIGNNYHQFHGAVERTALCELLTKTFPQFEVIGNGFAPPRYNCTRSIPFDQTADVYNEAYISISANIYNDYEGYFSNRPLDIMAAGGCCLMRYVPNLESMFTDMKHCVFYKTNEEAVDKINMLLENPELRNSIAVEGQKLIREKHTFDYRVLEINKSLETL